MPIAHAYLADADLAVNVWTGVVTFDDWIAHARRQLADPFWAPGRLRLTDTLSADLSHLDAEDVDKLSAFYAEQGLRAPDACLAIVAAAGWELAGRAHVGLEPLGVNTMLFTNVADACMWLGVDVGTVSNVVNELREHAGA